MYAVIRTGGKQYRVSKNDVIVVDRIDAKAGGKVKFDTVLMLGESGKTPTIGSPTVVGAGVSAEVLEQGRADKIRVVKFKRRKNYRRTQGHRQHQTVLKITDIVTKAATKTTVAEKETPKTTAKKAAPKKSPPKKTSPKTTPTKAAAKKQPAKRTPAKAAKKATKSDKT